MFVGLSVSVLLRECSVIVVCVVLSAWMSRLGNGGVSKCYAPITPDHIPTCYLTVHTDCLSLYSYLSVTAFICLAYTPFFHLVGASTRPESSQTRFQTAGISPADSCSITRSPLYCLSAYSCPLHYNICSQYRSE